MKILLNESKLIVILPPYIKIKNHRKCHLRLYICPAVVNLLFSLSIWENLVHGLKNKYNNIMLSHTKKNNPLYTYVIINLVYPSLTKPLSNVEHILRVTTHRPPRIILILEILE